MKITVDIKDEYFLTETCVILEKLASGKDLKIDDISNLIEVVIKVSENTHEQQLIHTDIDFLFSRVGIVLDNLNNVMSD